MRKFKFTFVLLAFFTLFTAYANDVVKVPADKIYDYISSLKEPGTYKIKITGLEQLDEFPKYREYGDYMPPDYVFRKFLHDGIYIDLSETEIPDGMDMKEAFHCWHTLVASPKFLGSVMDNSLEGTFYQCYSLKKVTNLPKGVANMGSTFAHCESLTVAPEIPDSVKSLGRCRRSPHYDWSYDDSEGTFCLCESLAAAPEIPSSVTDMAGTFSDCTSLTTAPKIPDSVTVMNATFYGCTSLTTAPEIPNSVTDMNHTFSGCTSLTAAPEIPDSVANMYGTFSGCTSLTTVRL